MDFKKFFTAEAFTNYGMEMPEKNKKPASSVKPQGKPSNVSFDDMANYQSRIAQGKSIEEEIRNKLAAEVGLVIQQSNANQDKNYGIDGFIVSKDGGKTTCPHIPVQFKARKYTSGNDILWETIKPWDQNANANFENGIFTGKDMKCKATYLISISNDGGTIRIRKVDEIMEISKELTKMLVQEYRSTGQRYVNATWGEARIVKDPSQEANFKLRGDIYKINCFIRPGVCEWKKDFNLKNPISMV